MGSKRIALTEGFRGVINKYSAENFSNTPDFILAEYLYECFEAFNKCSLSREAWYGKSLSILENQKAGAAQANNKSNTPLCPACGRNSGVYDLATVGGGGWCCGDCKVNF